VRSAGRECRVPLVDVARQQVRAERVRAGDDTVGTFQHVRGQACRGEGADNCAVGTSTFPPRWPHFFSEES